MKLSEMYLKLLRWGIFVSLFVPLIIFPQHLSPFHFGKAVVFRSLIEIMAVIYILLIFSTGKKYLPKWKPIIIALTVFTGLYALASFTAVDAKLAFWGTLERMGGLFSFLHLWVWFIILTSVFKDRKGWEKLLKVSIFVGFLSILFAYGQHFKLGDFFIGWQHEGRVLGTIGNAALFGGYLLFVLFLAIYLLLNNANNANKNANYTNKKWEKAFYALVLILGIPALHMTAVRGSIIAFWGGLFLLGLIYFFAWEKRKKVKKIIVLGLVLFLILVGFIWISKDKAWVENIHWLKRITDISLEDRTVQTRLWSWQSGFEGFKEKPVLGWGPENFTLVHARHLKPGHFSGVGSEMVWDRAHNVALEMLTTMGIIGLLSYLSIFAVVFWLLIQGFKRKRINLTTMAVFGAMLVAYFVHNLFIFDTIANYLMFFLAIGYISYCSRGYTQIKTQIPADDQRVSAIVAIILMALAVILIYNTSIKPAMANYACTRAILAGRAGDSQKAFDKYKQALSYKTYQGKYEIRHKLATFVIQYSENLYKKEKEINQHLLNYTIKEINKNIEAHPQDYVPYLYLERIYLILFNQDKSAGEKAEAVIADALKINPKNPMVWYELGQVKLSLKKYDEAIIAFEKVIEFNPEVKEALWFLGISHAKAGNNKEAIEYIDKAIKKGFGYKNSLNKIILLINLHAKVNEYYKVIELYKTAIELEPNNAQLYASLAATYKAVGDAENAILYARQAGEIDESFKEEVERFIKTIK